MKKPISVIMLLAVLVPATLAAGPVYGGSNGQGRAGEVVPDSYIVVLQDGVSVDEVAADHGVARKHRYRAVFARFSGKVPPGRVKALRNDPRVVSVSENRRVQADPKPENPGGGKGGGGGKNKPPVVEVTSPADGATFDSGTPIAFAGAATDDKDGDVSASIAWESSIGGPLGAGASISVSTLADGNHSITASATDSGGKTGSDSIGITVGSVPPPNNQIIPSGVQRIGAAGLGYTGAGVGVAIVDTGIDFGHADLSVASTCFTVYGSCQDDAGHGTHVAGIVAALDNSTDVLGVAPGAALYAVKVLDSSGGGDWADVVAGLEWVLSNQDKIQVVNMSLGGPAFAGDSFIGTAVANLDAAGISVVVSAGNERNDEITDRVPARFPEAMAVASSTAQDGTGPSKGRCAGMQILADTASTFTTDGAGVAISAPGNSHEDISKGCSIQGTGILSLQLGGGTTRKSGTSMAAPHVAGVAALMLEKNGTLTPAGVRAAIGGSADRQGTAPLDSPVSGYTFDGVREGILNAAGALQ
ncbi:MAG: S8 family serine peptidase [Dehalococcoidia bacterium]|jgi:subtilisin family serine protease|nr:S8 family serine peptidase [Dehalococcoidia bacterium]